MMAPDLLHLHELLPGLSVLPVRHGSLAFSEAARKALLDHRFEMLALDLPSAIAEEFLHAVEHLPEIWAATWIQDGRRWILPADPCDACTTAARVAIQLAHRMMAVVLACYLLLAAVRLLRTPGLRGWGSTLVVLVCTQFGLGIANVMLSLPLKIAVLHNAGAVALLFVLVTLLARLRLPEA